MYQLKRYFQKLVGHLGVRVSWHLGYRASRLLGIRVSRLLGIWASGHLDGLVSARIAEKCQTVSGLSLLVLAHGYGYLGQFIKISNNIGVLVFIRESGSGHLGFWASGNLSFWASGHLGQFIKISNNVGVLVFVREFGSGHLGFWASEHLGFWASGPIYLNFK